jgi:hypothetical protein
VIVLVEILDQVHDRRPLPIGPASHVLFDRAEMEGERMLLICGEVLVPEDEHLMLEQGPHDGGRQHGPRRL